MQRRCHEHREASGDGIADPIRVGMWPEHDQERALYANVSKTKLATLGMLSPLVLRSQ